MDGNNDSPERERRSGAREAATKVAKVLRDAGHAALFAGGCVRDPLLGLEPKDYDVATDAVPDRVRELFRRTSLVGAAFGVVLVRLGGHTIEVTTFRAEGGYEDGRRPSEVRFTGPEEDAERRDFTINGLFQDPFTDEIIDFVGGRADLAAGIIRAIGNAEDRLHEDRLRMLRAVRFAARFRFEIEAATAAAIRRGADELRGVSRERVGQELQMMFEHPERARAAELVASFGLDRAALEEPHRAPPLHHLAQLPAETRFAWALAAWAADRAGGVRAVDLPSVARRWTAALVLSNRTRADFEEALRIAAQLFEWQSLALAKRKRLAAREAFGASRLMVAAEAPDLAESIRSDVERYAAGGLAPTPLIDGHDLIELSIPAGPIYGRILDAVYDAQLEGRISDRNSARELAQRLAREENEAG